MNHHERQYEMHVMHDTYTLDDGIERTTVSYLDSPLEVGSEVYAALGPHAEEELDSARWKGIVGHNYVLKMTENTDGVRPKKVRAFMDAALGGPQKDLMFLDPDDFSLAWHGNGHGSPERGVKGAYLPHQDVAVVRRDAEGESRERLNPGQAEADAVHELAHSFGVPRWIIGKDGVVHLEVGFGAESAMEEGWACLVGGKYAVSELGRGNTVAARSGGILGRLEKHRVRVAVSVDGRQKIESRVGTPGAYASVTLERLIEADPQIFELMRESRLNPALLSDLESRLDRVVPGLYTRLCKIRVYSDPDAKKKLIGIYHEVDESLMSLPQRLVTRAARKAGEVLIRWLMPAEQQ